MFKKIFLLVLVIGIGLSACGTLDVSIEAQKPDATLTDGAAATVTPELSPTSPAPGSSATATPEPSTLTPVPLPPSSTPVQPPASNQPYRIRFEPNATWIEIVDQIDTAGGSRQYVLDALQYQVMSVSISPGQEDAWSFPLDVRAADGTSLCPAQPDRECDFWRGSLPATQDYYITVHAPAAGRYTMRVAINPPGLARQFFVYTDAQRSFELDYSDEFAPTSHLPTGNLYKGVPLLVLDFINPDFYDFSNLDEAAFMLNEIRDPQEKAACMDPGPNTEMKTVNGQTYAYTPLSGVAAGHLGEQLTYRILHRDTCYEIVFDTFSFSIENMAPELAAKYHVYDRERLLQKFEEILATFTLY